MRIIVIFITYYLYKDNYINIHIMCQLLLISAEMYV